MRLSQGVRITLLLSVVTGLGLACSVGALLTARRVDRMVGAIVTENTPSLVAAAELEKALQEQRGLVSAYMLDGGKLAWIFELDRRKPALDHWLKEARLSARTREEIQTLDLLQQVYAEYDRQREQVIALVQAGRTDQARQILLRDVAGLAVQASALCHQFVELNQAAMNARIARAHLETARMTVMVGVGTVVAVVAAALLLVLVLRDVLLPVRKLAHDARALAPGHATSRFSNDLRELEFYSRALMSDVSRTRVHLEESQERLVRSEKLAAIGHFAAGITHEIRNPLSAMRIWLYELAHACQGNPEAQKNLRVLEGEVLRLEELATSLLRFSRPPQLRCERRMIHEMVEHALTVSECRLHEKQLKAVAVREGVDPDVMADPDQIHQVLLNLIANAADATPTGGEIRITETVETGEGGVRECVVRVQDGGRGVAKEIRERLFEPFTTTKTNGTGLGLSIASDIMTHHGGRLVLESSTPEGCRFAIRLPACSA